MKQQTYKCNTCNKEVDIEMKSFHLECCPEGRFNESADKIKRNDRTWSDTNLNENFDNENLTFDRLKCRNCSGINFEVLITDSYETSARCSSCGMYYLVHCG